MQATQDTQHPTGSSQDPGMKGTWKLIFLMVSVTGWLVAGFIIYDNNKRVHQRHLPVFSQVEKPKRQLTPSDSFLYIINYDINEIPNSDNSDLLLTLDDGSKQIAANLPIEQLNFTLYTLRNGYLFDKKAKTILKFDNNVPPPQQQGGITLQIHPRNVSR